METLSRRLRAALTELRRSERGIALPMALMVTVVGMGLAAVPIVASVNSQGGNQRNQGSNEALAAAETGAELALKAQGSLHIEKGSNQLCVSQVGMTPTAGWCPTEPVNPENRSLLAEGTVGLAHYTYRVLPCYGVGASYSSCATVKNSAGCAQDPVQVVATGTAVVAGVPVERRVSVSGCAAVYSVSATEIQLLEELKSQLKTLETELTNLELPGKTLEGKRSEWEVTRTKLEELIRREKAEGKTRFETKTGTKTKTIEKEVPAAVFGGGQIVGIEGLTMNNGADVYGGGAGSNKSVSLTGNAQICGSVRYGTGSTFTATNGSNNVDKKICPNGRTVTESKPVTYPPVQLPANIATQNSDARLGSADPASGYQRGNISWNESKKELTVTYGELKVEGTLPYYLCKLTLAGGSKLVPGAGKSIRFFFPEPTQQNCPGLNGSPTQLVIGNGAEVYADSNHGPGFYFVGSGTKGASKVELGGGANVSQFLVYAPHSTITANNGVNLLGAIIGETLDIQGGSGINKSTYTPPSTTEFTAPEKVTETVQEPTSEQVLTVTGEHEDELRTAETEIQKLTEQINAINTAPIEEKKEEIAQKLAEISIQEKKIKQGEGEAGSTSFAKSGFIECSATPPNGQTDPAAGCA